MADNSVGITKEGFQDPSGSYPRKEYFNASSINYAARSGTINKLYLGGGDVDTPLDLPPLLPSLYPLNQVQETVSGHVIEYDDTPGNERILIKHNTGAGVEMRADGSVVVSAVNNKVEVTGGDQTVIVEGNGRLVYNGSLSLDVSGDFNLEVGGNFNVKTGTKREIVNGPCIQEVYGTVSSNVVGSKSTTVTGAVTQTYLSDLNQVVKGNQSNLIGGEAEYLVEQKSVMTSGTETIIGTRNLNIGAYDVTVIGVTGTIGGDGIVFYGEGANFDAGVTAPTFHGALEGNAKTATEAGRAGTAGALGAGGSAGTEVNVATPTTVKPVQTVLDAFLLRSSKGIRKVFVDIGDILKNLIDKSVRNGNVSNRNLSTVEIRSKLRDPATLQNSAFIANAIGEGKLNPKYNQTVPPSIGRTVKNTPTPTFGITTIGNNPAPSLSERFKTS